MEKRHGVHILLIMWSDEMIGKIQMINSSIYMKKD